MEEPEKPHTPDRAEHAAAKAGTRPPELEDWLNGHLYHPLARRLAISLQDTFVTPNALSVAGGAMVVIAGVIYGFTSSAAWAAIGLLVHMGWHVLDGADGDLARLRGTQSQLGEVVDGVCDYASHLFLYLVLAALVAAEFGPVGWAAMMSAGFARIGQTAFYETQRRQYEWWVYAKPWLRVTRKAQEPAKNRVLKGLARIYMQLSDQLAAGGAQLDAAFERLDPAKRQRAAEVVRGHLLPSIQGISILSSNYRTLVIGAAMIVGMPVLIIGFELVGLTLFWIAAMRRSRKALAAALTDIQAMSSR